MRSMGANLKIKEIIKRDERVVKFNSEKISKAISKALKEVGVLEEGLGLRLSEEVVKRAESAFNEMTPTVEDVQDIVENVLIENSYAEAAKAYILYRQKRTELREAKKFLGVKDDLKLGVNAVKVLEKRYLLKNEKGEVVETPKEMFRRVAKSAAGVEKKYDKEFDVKGLEEKFYTLLTESLFLPNSPTLMNAGTSIGQLSACFVLPVEDSIEGIFDTLKDMAIIHQSGGGTGFSFSKLRPKGDVVRSTKGIASGPVSFMKVFDSATDVIKQGGRRRGANMGILRFDHPDIIEFITSKEKDDVLSNFNISIGVSDSFMKLVEEDEKYPLINPLTGAISRELKAREVFNLIVTMAWHTGDPGIIFLDRINRSNPTPRIGIIESTNPCGEQPLLSYESCNLGSINLVKMMVDDEIDFEKLEATIKLCVRFLDNIIDANKFPLKEIEKVTKANRKIGLGVMGFAEMLIKLSIPYDSEEALKKGGEVMKFICDRAIAASVKLGKEKGDFPNFPGSLWEKKGFTNMRNATVTTVAPTGTISIIADTSSGIEPLFAISYLRNVMEGSKLIESNALFEKTAREHGFHSQDLMMKVAKVGSVQKIPEVPQDVKRIFVTALDIDPKWHVRMQAEFQKCVDNAVSKTVNLPRNATIDDVKRIYLLAYELGCKGITVYRYGSKAKQVLTFSSSFGGDGSETGAVVADSEFGGGCPTGDCF
jgi:ribonucleoside-diphosphate reductase alpha chain